MHPCLSGVIDGVVDDLMWLLLPHQKTKVLNYSLVNYLNSFVAFDDMIGKWYTVPLILLSDGDP